MTPAQIATNDRAVRNMAARLESVGFQGDAYELAEKLARNLVLDGYRPVERPEPMQPSTSTPEARQAALRAAQEAVDAAKRRITGKVSA